MDDEEQNAAGSAKAEARAREQRRKDRKQLTALQRNQTDKARVMRLETLARKHPEIRALLVENEALKSALESAESPAKSEPNGRKRKSD